MGANKVSYCKLPKVRPRTVAQLDTTTFRNALAFEYICQYTQAYISQTIVEIF